MGSVPERTAGGYSPTVKKRSLGRMLLRLRKEAGLAFTEVCKRTEFSPSTLSSIEKATWVTPSTDRVEPLLDLYGVEGEARREILQITKEARQRGWWRAKRFQGVFSNEFPGYEAGASKLCTYENFLIPGLLQSPSYVDLVNTHAGINDPAELARHRDARLERQKILTRPADPVHLHAVIDENVVVRITDPSIRAEQLAHILDVCELPNVTVQLVAISAGLYPGAGEVFTHLAFNGDDARDLIYLETSIDDRMLEEVDEIDIFVDRFTQLRESALDPEATRTYLRQQIE